MAATLFIGVFLPWMIRGMHLGVLTHFDLIGALDPLQPFGTKADFFDIAQRIDINVIIYTSAYLPSSVVPVSRWFSNPGNIFSWLLGITLLSLIVLGIIRTGKHRFFLSIYLLLYMAVLLLFPQSLSGHRFLIPILPLFYLALYIGLRSLTEKLNIGNNYLSGLMIVLILLNLWSFI